MQETINFADKMMLLADMAGDLEVAEIDLANAVAEVERVEEMLNDLRAQHEEYVQWNNQHRDEYQNKTDEFADAYDAASQEAKQAFKKDIMELFNKFREAFEESNNQYISMMNNLTGALYSKEQMNKLIV